MSDKFFTQLRTWALALGLWITLTGGTQNGVICRAETGFGAAASAEEQDTEEEVSESPKKAPPFRAFTRYKQNFKEFCAGLESDGRRELVLELVQADGGKDPGCEACRPLFMAIEAACKIKLAKRKPTKKKEKATPPPEPEPEAEEAEEDEETEEVEEGEEQVAATPTPEPTPIPIYHQRDPNLRVLQSLLSIFSGLVSDQRTLEPTYQAVQRLRSVLGDPEGRTIAEREYLATVCEYLHAPFQSHADRLAREERRIHAREEEQKRKIDVEGLLDF